jgi:hypothetical protein
VLEALSEIRDGDAYGLAEGHHFDEIKATLTTLAFADEGLILADPLGKLLLGQSSPLAFLPEQGKKCVVICGEY